MMTGNMANSIPEAQNHLPTDPKLDVQLLPSKEISQTISMLQYMLTCDGTKSPSVECVLGLTVA